MREIIITSTQEPLGTTEQNIPFGVEFEINNRWFQLNFVTADAYFVQELGTQDPTKAWVKKQQQELREWAKEQGLIDEN
jgi:hypothetical protein